MKKQTSKINIQYWQINKRNSSDYYYYFFFIFFSLILFKLNFLYFFLHFYYGKIINMTNSNLKL